MNSQTSQELMQAIDEAEALFRRTQAVLQDAKSSSTGAVFEHLDVLAKRAYELKIRIEWLRLVAAGTLEADAGPAPREMPDRRSAIDRRVAGMRRQILAVQGAASGE